LRITAARTTSAANNAAHAATATRVDTGRLIEAAVLGEGAASQPHNHHTDEP
jgi:hypothetical protein